MKQRSAILEQLLAFMYSQMSYFMQGADVMKDLEPSMRSLSAKVIDVKLFSMVHVLFSKISSQVNVLILQLSDMTTQTKTEQRTMEEGHSVVQVAI